MHPSLNLGIQAHRDLALRKGIIDQAEWERLERAAAEHDIRVDRYDDGRYDR